MRRYSRQVAFFLAPTLLLFIIVYLASIAILTGTSFTEWRIGQPISFAGLANYGRMFSDSTFWMTLRNTGIWILLQSTVHVAIGVTFALILVRREFWWKFARTVYMIPNIISATAQGMLFLLILNPQFGAINGIIRMLTGREFLHNWFISYDTAFLSITAIWLPFAPVVTVLVLGEVAAISESVFESARIDGASQLQINLHIILPMVRNIIGTCVILAATSMLQKLDIIMMTTAGGPGEQTLNLPAYLYRSALVDNNFAYANTLGVFLIVLGIGMVLLIRRLFAIGRGVE